MPKLLVYCTLGVITLYIGFGLLFYGAFGSDVKDLATLNLPEHSFSGNLFPFLFSLVGVVTMPINCFIISQSYEPLCSWPQRYLVRKWTKNIVRLFVLFMIY